MRDWRDRRRNIADETRRYTGCAYFIEITNPLTYTVNLTGYKIGDEETKGGGEGMYGLPPGTTITPNAVIIVARNAAQFRARFGFEPQYELVTTGALTDTLSVPNLDKYTAWASGSLALSNSGDEVLLLGPGDQIVDSVAWGSGDASASEPLSLQRYGTRDTNNMALDFLRGTPSPGTLVTPPTPPAPVPGTAMPSGMFAYWGDIHSHSTASDGDGPPRMAFDTARANGLHFFALTDHDSGLDTEEWIEIGNAARDATVDGTFIGLRGFEWTHSSKGHINVYNSPNYVTHNDPNYDTLVEFYGWIAAQPNIVAHFNHPDPTYGGTFDDFAYNAAAADKIALLEIGNNGDVPYKRFEPQYPQALNQHWRVAPAIGSDHHGLIWGNDSPHRTGIIAASLTMTNVLDALRARRVFATEDANLALALQSNGAWMGSTITTQPSIAFTITVRDPNPEPITLELYGNGALIATQAFPNSNVTWNVSATGNPLHYYYVRATQSDGDIAYTAPIWTAALPATPVPPTETSRDDRRGSANVFVPTPQPTSTLLPSLEGCVTVPPNILSSRFIYIQNGNQGLRVSLPLPRGNFPSLKLGDRVALRGIGADRWSARTIEIDDPGIIEMRGSCGTIAPLPYATGAIDRKIESLLVEVRGRVVNVTTDEIELNDGSGSALISTDPVTRISVFTTLRGQTVRVAGVVMYQNNRVALVPRYASDLTWPRATATPTRTPATLQVTATRRNTAAVSPTLRATRTPTPRRRAELFPLNEELTEPMNEIPLDAQAIAVGGGSTAVATGFACFALALALLRRR